MATSDRNKYEVLGVTEDADQREIRSAYRKLAMVHHPDKGGDKETFQEIQSAYETLGDEDARRRYDHQLRNPQQFSGSSGGFADFANFFGGGGGGGGFNFDFFGGGGGGFNFDFSGGGFGEDDQFEDFLRSAFRDGAPSGFNFADFSGGPPRGEQAGKSGAPPSWFFDFDMDDDEYFRRQDQERQDRRQKMEKFVEEQKEKRRIAKEQWHADKLKREKERPQNNHRKLLRKNVLKLVDKEAPEIKDELEDQLELITATDMEALWLVLSDRGSRSVVDCVVDAMEEFGHPITAPKTKKKSAKKNKSKADAEQKARHEADAEQKAKHASEEVKAKPAEAKSKAKAAPSKPQKAEPAEPLEKTAAQVHDTTKTPEPAVKSKPAAARVEESRPASQTFSDEIYVEKTMRPGKAESGDTANSKDQKEKVQLHSENGSHELQRPHQFLDQVWAFLLWLLSLFTKTKQN